jgi:hypothetical protein
VSVLRRLRSDDRGAGYLMAFIVLTATLVGAGVSALADAGRVSAAQRYSTSIAYEAARVGAQEILAGNGDTFSLDADAARTAAGSAAITLASGSDARLAGVRVDGDEVAVTITYRVDRWFPGLGPVTITEVGTAQFSSGITREGQ